MLQAKQMSPGMAARSDARAIRVCDDRRCVLRGSGLLAQLGASLPLDPSSDQPDRARSTHRTTLSAFRQSNAVGNSECTRCYGVNVVATSSHGR